MTQQPGQQQTQQQPTGQEDSSMMGHGGMMGRGMMGPPVMMRIMFSLMDSDGDGTISLQEFQAAHERIFKGMDANKDGRLTPEEMQAFKEPGRHSRSTSVLHTDVTSNRCNLAFQMERAALHQCLARVKQRRWRAA